MIEMMLAMILIASVCFISIVWGREYLKISFSQHLNTNIAGLVA
jgi:hypothetical protein